MAVMTYTLCMVTAALCTVLLFRAYRRSRLRLLLMSSWCFAGLTVANGVVVLDKVVFPAVDLLPFRLSVHLIALSLLLIGLLWNED